jgi:hypothetical protein
MCRGRYKIPAANTNMGGKGEGLSDLRRPSGRIYSLARLSFMIFLLFLVTWQRTVEVAAAVAARLLGFDWPNLLKSKEY